MIFQYGRIFFNKCNDPSNPFAESAFTKSKYSFFNTSTFFPWIKTPFYYDNSSYLAKLNSRGYDPISPLILLNKAARVLFFSFVFFKEFMTMLHNLTYFWLWMNSSCIYFVNSFYFCGPIKNFPFMPITDYTPLF